MTRGSKGGAEAIGDVDIEHQPRRCDELLDEPCHKMPDPGAIQVKPLAGGETTIERNGNAHKSTDIQVDRQAMNRSFHDYTMLAYLSCIFVSIPCMSKSAYT